MKQGTEDYVFLSYSSKEPEQVKLVLEALEENNIKCWKAPRSIPPGSDYTIEIFDAIAGCKVFVLMLSENSMGSKWVPRELDIAINNNKIIIPFHIDESQMDGRFAFYLCNVQKIDAYKKVKQALNELLERVLSIISKEKKSIAALPIQRFQGPSFQNIARPEIVKNIDELFQSGYVVCLSGIGGIGKSEMAKMYVKEKLDEGKIHLVSYNEYRDNLKTTISMIPFDGFDDQEYLNEYGKTNESSDLIEALYRKKVDMLQKCTQDLLLVLDGVDCYSDDELPVLNTLLCRVLITTRCDFREFGLIRLSGFSTEEEKLRLFTTHYEDYDPDDEEAKESILEMIDLVHGHTLTIKLLALVMQVSGYSPGEVLEALRQGPVLKIDFDENIEHGYQYGVAYNHIAQLFDLSQLSEDEIAVLEKLAFIPPEGIKKRLFNSWNPAGTMTTVDKLIKKGWVQSDKGNLSLHTMIQVVVNQRLSTPLQEYNNFFESFINYLRIENIKEISQRHEAANISHFLASMIDEESELACRLYLVIGTYLDDYYYWLLVGARNSNKFTSFIQMVNISNENMEGFQESLSFLHKAEKIMKMANRPNKETPGKVYSSLGCTYFNTNNFEKAVEYHKLALSERESLFGEEHDRAVGSRRRLGTTYMYLGQAEKALECYKKNRSILEFCDNPNWLRISKSSFDCGRAYFACGNNDQALRYYKDAINYLEKSEDTDYLGAGSLFYFTAKLILDMNGPTNEAEELLMSARELILKASAENNESMLESIDKEISRI